MKICKHQTITICLIGGSLLTCGCSAFTPPIEKPIIEDKSHASADGAKIAVFSTTAARRSVLVNFAKDAAQGRVCSEAPPDTADALVSSLTFAAEASAKTPDVDAAIKTELARTLSTTVKALLERSQGLQLYRDAAFHLCLAWQNEAITQEQYVQQHDALLGRAQALILAEIPSLDARKAQHSADMAAKAQDRAEAAADQVKAAQKLNNSD